MRKRLIMGALVFVLILLTVTQAKAAWWWPGGGDNVDELASTATYVVRVEVLSRGRLRVLEAFQGDVQPGDMVEMHHLGGGFISRFLLNLTEQVPRFPLVRGDDLVLFLAHWDSQTTLLNPRQGAYRFPNSDESTLTLDANVVMESVLGFDWVSVTIGDLQQLAEDNFGDGPREVLAPQGLRPINLAWIRVPILVIVVAGILIKMGRPKKTRTEQL